MKSKLKVSEIVERAANIEFVYDQVSQSESNGDRMSPSGAKRVQVKPMGDGSLYKYTFCSSAQV